MRIALLVHNYPPEFRGGTEQVVQALAMALQRLQHEVVVISGSEDFAEGGEVRREEQDGIVVFRLVRDPSEPYGLDLPHKVTTPRLTDLLLDERIEAVHLHHWWTLGEDLLRRARALGLRTGATLHDLWTTCPRFFRRPIAGVRCPETTERDSCVTCLLPEIAGGTAELVAGRLARRDAELAAELGAADFVTVPSEATKQTIERHLTWRGHIDVVPHGLLHEVRERTRPRTGDEPIRVGSFGNLVPEKGIDQLVEAVAGFGDEVELRLAGHAPDGAYAERLRARAKELGIPLVWTGPYGPDTRHPALDLDIAVFPSLCQESYGLVVDEALAHGVPVVVSARGALPERARHGGIVVRSGGIGPLRVALSRLLRSAREREALRQRIPARFPTIDDAARRYVELFQRQGE